jgi:hypothetical protein
MKHTALGTLFVDAVAPAFGLLLALWIIWNVETRFFPVVTDFTLDSMVLTDEGFVAEGTLHKKRNCELIGTTIFAVREGAPKKLLATYMRGQFGTDTATGHQTWGPLTLQLPADLAAYDAVEVHAMHRCHALWLQETTYMVKPVVELFK